MPAPLEHLQGRERAREMGRRKCTVDDSLARITVGKCKHVVAMAHAHVWQECGLIFKIIVCVEKYSETYSSTTADTCHQKTPASCLLAE